jgi:hypothetical protein
MSNPLPNQHHSPSDSAIHRADCSIWDTPTDSQPDKLLRAGVKDEVVAVYLGEVRPLYDAAKRCIGQLSGILLLQQINGLERGRDQLILASAAQQLRESAERLEAVKPPSAALQHHQTLSNLLALLGRVLIRLEESRFLVDPQSPNVDAVLDALHAAQAALMQASKPAAGLAPVDFKAACCNCRPKTRDNKN